MPKIRRGKSFEPDSSMRKARIRQQIMGTGRYDCRECDRQIILRSMGICHRRKGFTRYPSKSAAFLASAGPAQASRYQRTEFGPWARSAPTWPSAAAALLDRAPGHCRGSALPRRPWCHGHVRVPPMKKARRLHKGDGRARWVLLTYPDGKSGTPGSCFSLPP